MAEIQFNVNMDLVDKYTPAEDITIPQEDNLSVKFTYSIFNREIADDLTDATDIVVSFVKPDGHIVLQSDGTLLSPNKVNIVANAQAFTYVGKVYMQVQYKKGTTTFNTRQAFFWVERSNTSCQTVASADFAPYLDNVVATGEILNGLDLQALIDSKQTAEEAQADVNGIKPRVVALEIDVASLKTRMTAVEGINTTQNTRLTSLENQQGTFDTRITATETKNTAQDTRLTNLESGQTTQDNKITAVETKNTTQDTRLTALETTTGDIPTIKTDITAIKATNTTQDNRLSTLEAAKTANDTKNATQDTNIGNNSTAISGLQTSQTAQDTKIANLESYQTSSDTRITVVETKNTQQDSRLLALEQAQPDLVPINTRLTNVENKNTAQDTRLTDLETAKTANDTKNTMQDSRLTALENGASSLATTVVNNKTAQDTVNTNTTNSVNSLTTRVTSIETKNTQQDTRLDTAESKNATQDTKIATLEGANSVIITDIDVLESSVSGHETRLDQNDTKNSSQDSLITANTSAISSLTTTVNNNQSGMNTRVTALETAKTANDTKNTQQDSRLTSLENYDTQQDTRMTTTELDANKVKDQLKYVPNSSNPLIIPTYEGSNQTVHPKVVHVPTGWNGWKYWMAHTPYPNTNDDYENPSISVSNDGVNWIDPVGIVNPIDIPTAGQLADAYHMSDTHLLLVGDTLECWYRLNKNGVIDQVLRKTSIDGVTWTPREVMYEKTGASMILSPAIIYDGTKYKMWYVNEAPSVQYVETSNGGSTWTTPTPVNVTTTESPTNYRHWHLDVIKDGSNYEILLASGDMSLSLNNDRKQLLHGISISETSFTVYPIMYPTPTDSAYWDNYYLYRACIVKISGRYKIYYSAMSQNNRWHVGLTEGEDVRKLRGFSFGNMEGDLVNVNDVLPARDVVLNVEKKVYLKKSKTSYLDHLELKMVKDGEGGVRLKYSAPNMLEVRGDNNLSYGDFRARKFVTNLTELSDNELKLTNPSISGARLRASSRANTVEIKNDANTGLGNLETNFSYVNKILAMTGMDAVYTDDTIQITGAGKRLKFVNPSVNGAGLSVGNAANSVRVLNDLGTQAGLLEVAGLLLSSGVAVPTVEGALRYNATNKSYEGYNGSGWYKLTDNSKDTHVDLPLTADATAPDVNYQLSATRRGNTVTLSGAVTVNAGAAGSQVIIAVLPSGVRPTKSLSMYTPTQDGTLMAQVYVNSGNGNIALNPPAKGKRVDFVLTYAVD
ncbi:hypothetical protein [Bacillus mycoides]|uniref:hypothetical protein n=1 Tax=Bacillus mycoides TaxID=1405 RepID=UPI00027C1980|nr:hypothetical protein [Bacillus mycoides]EJV59380.1 hypothetical protein IEU_05645 [Bacillus mycoides]